MKRIIAAAIVAFLGLVSLLDAHAQLPAGLHVQGVTLVNAAGDRFVISGINMELFRDKGCKYVTEGTYPERALFASTFQSMGINAVRLNYSYAWLNEAGNLDKFMDVAQELVIRGIYVMPSDHTYTGDPLVNSAAVYPMFLKIVEAFRARNIEAWLIMNPFNEPGGDPEMTPDQWLPAQKNVLTYLRNTAAFDGVVVLDTWNWSLSWDAHTFDAVLAHDASLRGGTANIVLSQHYYPTNGMKPVDTAFANSDKYPLLVGEAGWYNASPTDPQYVRDVISKWFNVARPKGHNGMFAWIAQWCDTGKMFYDWTDPSVAYSDPLAITDYGKIWVDNYYSKLGGLVPPPSTPIVQLPSATPTARATALPTNTRATRTRTPVPTAPPVTVVTNTPSPLCDAVIEANVTLNGRPARSTTCIRYR